MSGKLSGTVVSVADSGNLITDITSEALRGVPRDERTTIRCDGHVTAGIYSKDHGQPDLTFLALLGDADVLELAIVSENAAAFLGISCGAAVRLSW